MADFFIRELIGEIRAAVVENGKLVEMHIRREGDGVLAGTRAKARLTRKMGTRGIATLNQEEILLQPWPNGATEGQEHMIEVTRAAWKERGRDRNAKARPTTLGAQPATSLPTQLKAAGHAPKGGWPSTVEEQWQDAFEQAERGHRPFVDGSLSLIPTPAFVAVDVDGTGQDLARQSVIALAQTIRLWGLGGGIVADLPNMPDKAARNAVSEAFDKAMAGIVHERTAINGFGLLQIIRQRTGPSILERAQLDRAGTQAISALEQTQKASGTAPITIRAQPAVLQWLQNRPNLLETAQNKAHRQIDLIPDPLAATAYVET